MGLHLSTSSQINCIASTKILINPANHRKLQAASRRVPSAADIIEMVLAHLREIRESVMAAFQTAERSFSSAENEPFTNI
jgi:hypothetical protein